VSNVLFLGNDTDDDTNSANNKGCGTGSKDLLLLVSVAVFNHVNIDVVGNSSGSSQNQTGHNSQDCCKGNGAEEG